MNENEMAMEALKWIVSTIHERYEDANKEYEADKDDAFCSGRQEAYWEVMDIIQSRVEILGVDVKTPKAG